MSPSAFLQRHPALRWLAPAVVVGVASLVANGAFRAQASSEPLPNTTPAALIAAAQQPRVAGFSGTVVSHLSLGLPDLSGLGDNTTTSDPLSLLSGAHTLQVWYAGPQRQRVAVLGSTDETDYFRSGGQFWRWSSSDRTAVHTVLPPRAGTGATPSVAAPAQLTPTGLATAALRLLRPSTRVEVSEGAVVADRPAYELILTPRSSATRIGSVHLFVDGATKLPLGVQVYARGNDTPAIDVAYSSIRFGQPMANTFSFTPPAGATVRTLRAGRAARTGRAAGGVPATGLRGLDSTGSGWTTVWSSRLGDRTGSGLTSGPLGQALTPVSGSWGSGGLLEGDLASVLVTDDGHLYVGAVDPAALYAAAAK